MNNKTQAIVCQDLGLCDYIVDVTVSRFARKGFPVKMQADLLEGTVICIFVFSKFSLPACCSEGKTNNTDKMHCME